MRRIAAVAAVGVIAALALPGQALAGADNFASAGVLTFAPANDIGSNAAATVEAGEPKGVAWLNGPNKTHWLVWQAPQTSSATITTCGSSFDTMLAVWTGRSLASLQEVASSDDNAAACGGGSLQSGVTFNAVGGQRYRIQVDGFNGATGNYQVHITQSGTAGQPPNDDLANALTISGSNIGIDGGNVGATMETGENNHFDANQGASVWYSWTAPSAGTVTVDTCGSNFDTVLAVYRGTAFPLRQVVNSDDDNTAICPSSTASRAVFSTASGVTYRIAVAGFRSTSTGYLNLTLALATDTTAPDTDITGGPTGLTASPDPSFNFTTPEPGAGFQCKLDGPGAADGTYAACDPPKAYSSLADGDYTFTVRAVDGSNNVDDTPSTRSFTIDMTGPDTSIGPGPSGPISTDSPSFAFSSPEGGATFECRLDGPGATSGSYTSCTSPQDYSSLAEGTYTFSVRAIDGLGNSDSSPATSGFTVDTTAPDTSLDSAPSGTIASDTASFAFSSPDSGASFQCRLDGPDGAIGSYAACASPKEYASLANGGYTFSVRAVDAAGNTDASAGTRSFTVAKSQAPPGGSPPPGADLTPPVGSASVPKQKLGKVLKSGKLIEDVSTNEAASVSAQAVLAAKLAKGLGLPPNGVVFPAATRKPAIVAKGTGRATAAGKVRVTLKLTSKARKKFKKLRKVTLSLRTQLIDAAGNRSLVVKKVTLKR